MSTHLLFGAKNIERAGQSVGNKHVWIYWGDGYKKNRFCFKPTCHEAVAEMYSSRSTNASHRTNSSNAVGRDPQFSRDARSKIAASSFSGLFTRVEIGHMIIGSAG